MQGEAWEDLALLRGPTTVGGTILDENFRVFPVLSSTRRSDTRSAPARATVGTKRFRACPFRVTRACPAASLFAPGLGERGLQLAARAAPRIVRARPADLVCNRPAVSLAVFLEDAPIGVPSSPATAAGSSVLQRVLQRGRTPRPRAGGGSASSNSTPRPVRLRFNPADTPRPGRTRLWQTGRSLDSLNRGLIALNEHLVV